MTRIVLKKFSESCVATTSLHAETSHTPSLHLPYAKKSVPMCSQSVMIPGRLQQQCYIPFHSSIVMTLLSCSSHYQTVALELVSEQVLKMRLLPVWYQLLHQQVHWFKYKDFVSHINLSFKVLIIRDLV